MDRALGGGDTADTHCKHTPTSVSFDCASFFSLHVEGHVVGGAVLVSICDVMDCTDGHDDLPRRVDNGQVNNSSVQKGGRKIQGSGPVFYQLYTD